MHLCWFWAEVLPLFCALAMQELYICLWAEVMLAVEFTDPPDIVAEFGFVVALGEVVEGVVVEGERVIELDGALGDCGVDEGVAAGDAVCAIASGDAPSASRTIAEASDLRVIWILRSDD